MGRAYIGNFKGPRGETGNSAYQSAQAGGYTGTETEFEQAVTKFASSYFGYFPTLEDLKTNHPTGVQGTFAIVNREIAIWSPADQNWVVVDAEKIESLQQTKANKSETVFDAKRAYQNYTTVLEMVNSVSHGGTVIAFGDNQSALFNAADRPPTVCEYFYFILSDGLRKNVVAFGFASPNIYMRRVWDKVWSTDWTRVGIQNIDGLLNGKADKNKALQTNLYAQYAQDVQAPNLNITSEILFNNPPLDNMALLDHRGVFYAKADRPAGAPPMSSSMIAQYLETLTFKTNRNRALQVATQCYMGDDNGRVFLRTRHRDNDNFDYTQWQAWKEAATCYCADMEWKTFPMVNDWTNAVNDPYAALKYRKGGDGKTVYVRGYIKRTNDLTAENKIFAYLPAGYRPSGFFWGACAAEVSGTIVTCRVDHTTGRMYIANAGLSEVNAICKKALPICLTIPI